MLPRATYHAFPLSMLCLPLPVPLVSRGWSRSMFLLHSRPRGCSSLSCWYKSAVWESWLWPVSLLCFYGEYFALQSAGGPWYGKLAVTQFAAFHLIIYIRVYLGDRGCWDGGYFLSIHGTMAWILRKNWLFLLSIPSLPFACRILYFVWKLR